MDEHSVREIVRQELANFITRGQVKQARMGGRAMVQATGLEGETFSNLEMLQPHGVSGLPKEGADILLMGMAGRKDGGLALFADEQGAHLPDAQPGDRALTNGASHLVVRDGGAIQAYAEGETLRQLVTSVFMDLFNNHTHPVAGDVTEAPGQQMNVDHLTKTFVAGGS